MSPRIVLFLITLLIRQDLKNPPAFDHLQLVVYRRQSIKHILLLFVDERFFELDGLLVVLRIIDRRVKPVGETARSVVDEGRTTLDVGIEAVRIEADVLEHVLVKEDTRVEDEALADHPAQRDTR